MLDNSFDQMVKFVYEIVQAPRLCVVTRKGVHYLTAAIKLVQLRKKGSFIGEQSFIPRHRRRR